MDANTPAWLRDNTVEASSAPSAPVPTSNGVISSVPPPAAAAAVAPTADADDNNPDLPGVILTMRLANIGVSIAMIVTSVRINVQASRPVSRSRISWEWYLSRILVSFTIVVVDILYMQQFNDRFLCCCPFPDSVILSWPFTHPAVVS
jgi:hypothetical protein